LAGEKDGLADVVLMAKETYLTRRHVHKVPSGLEPLNPIGGRCKGDRI